MRRDEARVRTHISLSGGTGVRPVTLHQVDQLDDTPVIFVTELKHRVPRLPSRSLHASAVVLRPTRELLGPPDRVVLTGDERRLLVALLYRLIVPRTVQTGRRRPTAGFPAGLPPFLHRLDPFAPAAG